MNETLDYPIFEEHQFYNYCEYPPDYPYPKNKEYTQDQNNFKQLIRKEAEDWSEINGLTRTCKNIFNNFLLVYYLREKALGRIHTAYGGRFDSSKLSSDLIQQAFKELY